MDKALPARTQTSGFPSELSRASTSTSKAAWGPSRQVVRTLCAFHRQFWTAYLRWWCWNHTGVVSGHKHHNSFGSKQSLIYESSAREAMWWNRKEKILKKGKKTRMDSPSHTILCWHGKKWMSKASSEQTRHSVGTATLETLRLVIVLGVVCTRRRLQVMAELSEETCCSLQPQTRNKIWATYSRSSFSNQITLYWSLANTPHGETEQQMLKGE